MSIRCWDELVRYGVDGVLSRIYGSMIQPQPEPEYNVTLQIDLEKVPPEGGKFEDFTVRVMTNQNSPCFFRGAGCAHQVAFALETQCVGCTF